MQLIIAFAGIVVLISLFEFYYLALFLLQIDGFLLSLFCVTAGIISFRKKNKYAKFYLFGYGAYLLGLILFIGSDYDIFPFFNQRIYVLEAGAIAEAVMLSFAIGEKLNSANRDRAEAQERALIISLENEKIIREQNIVLEQKVNERTLQLQNKNKIIEEKNRDILDSIRYAERIQKSFMATRELLDENLKDYFIFFKPKDVVSGDFFWAGKLLNGNFVLATADSTGHGVPGAIMSLLNITSLEKATENFTNPSDILSLTRHIIVERLKNDGSVEGGKDGMDCSLISLSSDRKNLKISAANSPVLVIRKGEVIEIKPDKMPVGKHDNQNLPFTVTDFSLEPGDMIYTLTDGFQDQFGGPNGKKFMIKNLRNLLLKNSNLEMNEQMESLEKTFSSWKENHEQVDDVTVIGIRI